MIKVEKAIMIKVKKSLKSDENTELNNFL